MCILNEILKKELIFFEIFDIASAAFITVRKVCKYGFFCPFSNWDEYGEKYGPEKSLACIIIAYYDLPACRLYSSQISYIWNRNEICENQTSPLKKSKENKCISISVNKYEFVYFNCKYNSIWSGNKRSTVTLKNLRRILNLKFLISSWKYKVPSRIKFSLQSWEITCSFFIWLKAQCLFFSKGNMHHNEKVVVSL